MSRPMDVGVAWRRRASATRRAGAVRALPLAFAVAAAGAVAATGGGGRWSTGGDQAVRRAASAAPTAIAAPDRPSLLAVAVPAPRPAEEFPLRPPPMAACFAWEAHLMPLLEQSKASGVAASELAAAYRTLATAQVACHLGHVGEAQAAYESVSLEPARDTPLR